MNKSKARRKNAGKITTTNSSGLMGGEEELGQLWTGNVPGIATQMEREWEQRDGRDENGWILT